MHTYIHVSGNRMVQNVSAKNNTTSMSQRNFPRSKKERMSHIRLERITFWKYQDWNQMRYHCANGPNEPVECCLFVNMNKVGHW